VIAAHALARRRPVLVANIGTALTLDAVAADGRHLGGAIAPGPSTMIDSLLNGTQGIRRRAQGARSRTARGARKQSAAGWSARGQKRIFAADTASALDAGAAHAAAALIDRAAANARIRLRTRPLLLLTGGGAAPLRTYISTPARLVPDLVLRGLAVLAGRRT
jgi:type III pantothenate kinase